MWENVRSVLIRDDKIMGLPPSEGHVGCEIIHSV
jgi:hypothetical protein